ncbi:MAG TPA: transcriptional regulator [Candidatus Tectomicrobia bacterium]
MSPALPKPFASGVELRTARRVREQLGGVSEVTLWRFQRDPNLGFPTPVRINGRLYFRVDEIDAWIESRQNTLDEEDA